MTKTYLTDIERDQLIEVINMGSGNASTALSKTIQQKIKVSVPEIIVDAVEKVPAFLGNSGDLVSAILLKMQGDAPGIMLLLFPPDDVLKLLGHLTKKTKNKIEDLDDFDKSALREVGNILSGAVLSAFSNFLGIQMIESVPEEATDMLGAIVDSILAEIGQESDIVLVFKVEFNIENDHTKGELFFLFDPKSTDKILKITKEKMAT